VVLAEDGVRDFHVTGVQTCALPISSRIGPRSFTATRRRSIIAGTVTATSPERPVRTTTSRSGSIAAIPTAWARDTTGTMPPSKQIGRASGRESVVAWPGAAAREYDT